MGQIGRRTALMLVLALLAAGCDRPDRPDAPGGDEGAEGVEAADSSEGAEPPERSATESESGGTPVLDVERESPELVAIGDLHGDIDPLYAVLREARLIDAEDNWIGGRTTLVQTGDVLDRGEDEREIYELLWKLRDQAKSAGGRVVLLVGNHEVMNIAGDLRYVTPNGANDFSEYELPSEPKFDAVPPQMRGRLAAFLPGGPWAERLARQPVIAKVDGILFAHAGVRREHVEYGIDEINREVSTWMEEGGAPPKWVTDTEGPLWTRTWSSPEAPDCSRLDAVLKAADARAMAVGHTPQLSGIESRCDGKLWLIDTGMAEAYGGPAEALALVGETFKVVEARE